MYTANINGALLRLETSPEIFSPSSLDGGTLAMIENTEILPDDRVLDLGCGCGIVGIYAAKITGPQNVVMCDISPEAVRLSEENARLNGVLGVRIYLSDGFGSLPDFTPTLVLSNPPYHADFSVAKRFIEGGYSRLAPGGRMVMVTKRLEWYKNKLAAVFGGVRVTEAGGYYVFTAEKRAQRPEKPKKPQKRLSKKLARKYGEKT